MRGLFKHLGVVVGTVVWGVVVHYVGSSAPDALPNVAWAQGLVSALVSALPAALLALWVKSPRL